MQRTYQPIIQEHITSYAQMLFLAGPRQVGKTTLLWATQEASNDFNYYNWDNIEDREKILRGHAHLIADTNLAIASTQKPIIALDEIHKYKRSGRPF